MTRYRLKCGGKRKKALFGSEEGAILAAAGINAATQLSVAGMNAASMASNAKEQAQATANATKSQVNALKQQRENDNRLQEQLIDSNKQLNDDRNQIIRDMNTNLAMMSGNQNEADRLQAARIQVKCGGKGRSKAEIGYASSLLRGRPNIPFKVTDGGGVIPLGSTSEGHDLYMAIGNDHDHYHKAPDGKYKTGVGIKFANKNEVIELQGNQKSKIGELVLVTPDGGAAISKNSIKGFNPAKAVLAGIMSPEEAFSMQEYIKALYGINDDGSSSPVEKMKYGGRSKLACGGRRKAYDGLSFKWLDFANQASGYAHKANENYNSANKSSSNNSSTTSSGSWLSNNAGLIGAGINTLGNLGGALLTNWGNNRAEGILSSAYRDSANAMIDAYKQMRGIDPNLIKRSDYEATPALAVLRTPYINVNPQLTQINRMKDRRLSSIDKGTLSSAAAQSMKNRAESDAYDMRSQVYGQATNATEQIMQKNNDVLNRMAMQNAQNRLHSMMAYNQARNQMLQYNNNIENQKILGIGETTANMYNNIGQLRAGTTAANTQGWASALTNSGNTWSNYFDTNRKYNTELAWIRSLLDRRDR